MIVICAPVCLNGTSEGNLLIENPGNNAKLLQISILIDDTSEEVYYYNWVIRKMQEILIDKIRYNSTYISGKVQLSPVFNAFKTIMQLLVLCPALIWIREERNCKLFWIAV